MNGRKAIVGLSLLWALLFSAVVAQGASAGQTAFTCQANVTTGAEQFSDAHCDTAATGNAGFKHVVIAEPTNIKLTNGKTKNNTTEAASAVLHVATLHGISNLTVTCTTVAGIGTMSNVETGGVMEAKGEGEISFTGCTTNAVNCSVTNPITATVKAHTVEAGLEPAGMGLKFEPLTAGGNLTTITFTGASCGFRLFPNIPIKGTVVATANGQPNGGGATAKFAPTNSMEALTVGGEPAELTETATLTNATSGAALTTTTTTP
jgi:hypothetical protein